MARRRTPLQTQRRSNAAPEAMLYARVSSKEQEKEGFSIPAQLKLLNSYAETQGFRVIREFIDVETARKSGRTGFREMVSLFQKELSSRRVSAPCRILLVEKTDRLYRNMKDYVLLDELDLEIHMVKEGTILSNDSHSSAKFMHGIKVLMAKNYVDNLSEETRKGMLEKAEEGIWPSSAPVGYRNVSGSSGKRIIEPDSMMASLVTRLFEMYATGQYNLRQLSIEFHEAGLLGRKEGAVLSRSQLHQVLNNPLYYGEILWKGKSYQGIHAPLISRELFDRCQEVMKNKSTHRSRQQKHGWAFQGLVFCGHCGGMLTAEIKKQRYVYYHCSRNNLKEPCPEKFVREEELARQLGEAVAAIRLDPQVLEWLVRALKESHSDERRLQEETIERLERQAHVLRERLSALYVDKLDGKVSPEVHAELSHRWTLELDALRARLSDSERAEQSTWEEGARLLELVNRASELYEKQGYLEQRRLLNFVLSNSIWKDGKLHPVYRKPFDLLVVTAAEEKEKGPDPSRKSDPCQEWLPPLNQTAQRNLLTWQHIEDLPAHPGYGLARHTFPGIAELRRKRALAKSAMQQSNESQSDGQSIAHARRSENHAINTLNRGRGSNNDADHAQLGSNVGSNRAAQLGSNKVPFGSNSAGSGSNSRNPNAAALTPTEGASASLSRQELFRRRRQALTRSLQQALGFSERLTTEPYPTIARIAKDVGLTRSRVGQLLKLTQLVQEIQSDIQNLELGTPLPPETELWPISSLPEDQQLIEYRRACATARKPTERRSPASRQSVNSIRGLQNQFVQARKLQRMVDAGEYVSLRELADAAGYSTAWVTHLLNLNALAPDIIARLDVPADQLPLGITVYDVRVLARIRSHEEQREAFAAMVKEGKTTRRRGKDEAQFGATT